MSSYKATWPSGLTVTWRDLTWQEYEDICGHRDVSDNPPEIAIEVFKICVIAGPDVRIIPAGIVSWVAAHQINSNPFNGTYSAIDEAIKIARQVVNNDYMLNAQAVICNVFDYKLEEVKTWTPTKVFLRLAQAEVIVGREFNPSPPTKEVSEIPNIRPSPREYAKQRYVNRSR